jgi:Na+-translocating ferredoxin:NAD+ oxidoreductase subunit B
MAEDIYRKVQQQLDQYSIGFPETESGVEIKILKFLFNEEEAALFNQLNGELETPSSIAQRIGQVEPELIPKLETLAQKRLIYRLHEGGAVKYSAIPFIHGLLEFQDSWMSQELVDLTAKYIREKLRDNLAGGTGSGMRVLPVKEAVDVQSEVATYDDVYEILKNEELIAVADCSCRLQRKVFDKACDSLMEACIMVGPMADYYLENNMGRKINLEESMEIIAKSHEQGLVTQTQSITRPFMICNCCKCCCGFLGAVRRMPTPAQLVISNHIAVVDPEKCTGCESCIDMCLTQAIKMDSDNIAQVDYDRCIGCGLCEPVCPDDARALLFKPKEEQNEPKESLHEQMMRGAKHRTGKAIARKDVVSFGYE